MDSLTPLSRITDALENFEQLATEFNAQLSSDQAQLPSVSDLKHLMNTTSQAQGILAGGKKMKSGGSKKKIKKSKTSRSRRADLRERYKLSPRKRGKKNKKSKRK
jgi:hypothetical protein